MSSSLPLFTLFAFPAHGSLGGKRSVDWILPIWRAESTSQTALGQELDGADALGSFSRSLLVAFKKKTCA